MLYYMCDCPKCKRARIPIHFLEYGPKIKKDDDQAPNLFSLNILFKYFVQSISFYKILKLGQLGQSVKAIVIYQQKIIKFSLGQNQLKKVTRTIKYP